MQHQNNPDDKDTCAQKLERIIAENKEEKVTEEKYKQLIELHTPIIQQAKNLIGKAR